MKPNSACSVLFVVIVLSLINVHITHAATVHSLVAAGLTNPTAMALAPDGRSDICDYRDEPTSWSPTLSKILGVPQG